MDVQIQYADRPPEGYQLASNRQVITAADLVYRPCSSTRDAEWVSLKPGQNIIGSRVHDHWPEIMGLAVKRG